MNKVIIEGSFLHVRCGVWCYENLGIGANLEHQHEPLSKKYLWRRRWDPIDNIKSRWSYEFFYETDAVWFNMVWR